MNGNDVLTVDNLAVQYPGNVLALAGISLRLRPGGCLGVIGESGSGKSTLARVLLGLADGADISGSARVAGHELIGLDSGGWQAIRWRRIALAFQATGALNPSIPIGEQVAEPMRRHLKMSRAAAAAHASQLLGTVGLGDWATSRLPRQLSGGQRRLALIATALACDPDVLVLDEPTSGLDPLARRKVLDLLAEFRREGAMTQLVLTHDIDLVRELADQVAVLYRGWVAESGPAQPILEQPGHPYTWGLLNAVPSMTTLKELRGIRAATPGMPAGGHGCAFAGRCTQTIDICTREVPPEVDASIGVPGQKVACHRGGRVSLIAARGLSKSYIVGGVFARERISALDGVDLDLREAEVLGILGGNGAGKSTLSLLLAGLMKPDSGAVSYRDVDTHMFDRTQRRDFRREVQLVQQDPFEALSPRLTVRQLVEEPLELLETLVPDERRDAVVAALQSVRLPIDRAFLSRFAHELSGGQLQRVNVARALILQPKVLILDEPVAMLDPSEQAELLHLLKAAQVAMGMAMVLVSHDLPVLFRMADRVIVMEAGRVVEQGSGESILRDPQAAYTKAILAAIGRGPAGESVSEPPSKARATAQPLQHELERTTI